MNFSEILGGNEKITGDVAVITTDHKYIHKGKAFTVSIISGELAKTTGVEKIRFKTGPAATGYVHWRSIGAASTADLGRIELYEGATFTDNGTTITPLNRNRPMGSTITTHSILGKAATSSDNGTLISSFIVGAGGKKTANGGGVAGEADELIFKADTEYMIVMSNIGTANKSSIYIGLTWYEEKEYKG